MIFIKAIGIRQFNNSIFGIELESIHLDENITQILRDLFPNTIESIYNLLEKEALLASIVPEPSIDEEK